MKKGLIAVLLLFLSIVVIVKGMNFQTVEEYYGEHPDDIANAAETVSLSIRCDTILSNYDLLDKELRNEKYVPKDGIILAETRFVLRANETVFDLLEKAVRLNRIQMEIEGDKKNRFTPVYVKGMNHLYEYSCGSLSGWLFRVNGVFADTSCSDIKLKNGDIVEWIYSCDLGNDLDAKF